MDGYYPNESATAKIQASVKKKEKKPIAKMSEKAKAAKKEEVNMFAADKEFYSSIWLAAPHVCEVCKLKLGKEPLTVFFHHILNKFSFPGFRHVPENILIVCKPCHNQIETDISKVPYAVKRKKEVTKELLG